MSNDRTFRVKAAFNTVVISAKIKETATSNSRRWILIFEEATIELARTFSDTWGEPCGSKTFHVLLDDQQIAISFKVNGTPSKATDSFVAQFEENTKAMAAMTMHGSSYQHVGDEMDVDMDSK